MGQLANTLINAIADYELEGRIAALEGMREAGRFDRPTSITIRAGESA